MPSRSFTGVLLAATSVLAAFALEARAQSAPNQQGRGWDSDGFESSAPVLRSPTGTIAEWRPAFVWEPYPGATAYRVTVVRADGGAVAYTTYISANTFFCPTDTCSVRTDKDLLQGSYLWWVRATNGIDIDVTSAPVPFTVHFPVPPAPTVLAPSGSIATLAPTYRWATVPGATWYYLWVTTDGRAPAIQRWYQYSTSASATDGFVCDSSMCIATPPVAVPPSSSHTVWVQAWNPEGYSDWSQGVRFSTGPYPPGPVGFWPSGTNDSPQPRFNWEFVTGAYAYDIWLGRTGETTPFVRETFDAATYCPNGGCAARLSIELPDGAYTYWVLPIYPFGTGNWGPPKNFTVAAPVPPAPQPNQLVNDMMAVTSPPLASYLWSSTAGTWFYLWIQSEDGAVLHTKWYRAIDVCTSSFGPPCGVKPDVPLPLDKSYTWWVQAWNSRGYGPWSAPATFHVTSHAPGAATLLGPSGPGADANPIFTWQRELSTRYYRLWVNPVGAPPVANVFLTAKDICDATTCAFRPGLNLPAGSYQFWLQGTNELGTGPWSPPMAFQR